MCGRYTTTPLHNGRRACVCIDGSSNPPAVRTSTRLSRLRKSGRPDSNRRSQAPRACGLARLSHALFASGRIGVRSSGAGTRTGRCASKARGPGLATPGLENPRERSGRAGRQRRGIGDGQGFASRPDSRRRSRSIPPFCCFAPFTVHVSCPRVADRTGRLFAMHHCRPRWPSSSRSVQERRRNPPVCSRELDIFGTRRSTRPAGPSSLIPSLEPAQSSQSARSFGRGGENRPSGAASRRFRLDPNSRPRTPPPAFGPGGGARRADEGRSVPPQSGRPLTRHAGIQREVSFFLSANRVDVRSSGRSVADLDPRAIALECGQIFERAPHRAAEPEPARLGDDHDVAPGDPDLVRADLIANGLADLPLDPAAGDGLGVGVRLGLAGRPAVSPHLVSRRGQRCRRREQTAEQATPIPGKRGRPGGLTVGILRNCPIPRRGGVWPRGCGSRQFGTRRRAAAERAVIVHRLDRQGDGLARFDDRRRSRPGRKHPRGAARRRTETPPWRQGFGRPRQVEAVER